MVVLLLIATGRVENKVEDTGKNAPVNKDIPYKGFGDIETGAVIAVGMSREEMEGQFEDWEVEEGTDKTYYIYNGVCVGYDENDTVEFVSVNSSNATETIWESNRGLRLGDTLEEAFDKHGKYSKLGDIEHFVVFYKDVAELYVRLDKEDRVYSMFY